jgi:hypothetical protein
MLNDKLKMFVCDPSSCEQAKQFNLPKKNNKKYGLIWNRINLKTNLERNLAKGK